jgi:hypothetical protein
LIYFSTLDNEVLIPNLKIVDLIFLNPQKYKKLKVITTTSNFTNFQGEEKYEKAEKSLKSYTSKRYDVLQSTSEYQDDKDTNKINYGLYKLSDDTNLKTTGNNNVSDYNLPNEKAKEATNELNSTGEYKYKSESFLNVTKDKEMQNKINYLRSKNNSQHDDEYSKHNYEEYTSNYNKNINKTSLDVPKQETIPTSSTAGKNVSNYEYSNYYDKNDSSYIKEKRNSKINTAGQKYEYENNLVGVDMNSKVANSTLPKNYSTKYIGYGDNNNANDMISNNNEIVERSKSHLNLIPFTDKNLLRRESATPNPNRIEDSVRGSTYTTNPNEYNPNKYNFSERDDANRVRFSTEKRNFRNSTVSNLF